MLKNRCYAVAVGRIKGNNSDFVKCNFNVIKNGWNYWVADPFPYEYNGKLYIFGEMFEYKSLKGSIAYTELTENGFTKWKKIIEEPYHLSFPNIIVYREVIYMCPEAHQSKQLYLYKCKEFPEKWEKFLVLANNVNYSDTIFFKKNEEVYGFTCEWDKLSNHMLKIFKIEDKKIELENIKMNLLGNLMSRPAGKIFYDEKTGGNIMVSQICTPLYGSGLIFKKFQLNEMEYTESELCRVYPDVIKCNIKKKFDGIHTYNRTNNYVVIDLIWSRFNFIEKTFRLINKVAKRFL